MNKSEIINRLQTSRQNFNEAIQDLPQESLEEPGVLDNWSIKDILIHLTFWEAELIKLLWQTSQGQKPTSAHFGASTVDELNERWYLENRARPFERVLADFQGIRKQTLRRIETFKESDLKNPRRFRWLQDQPLWEWIAADSFEHEEEHAEQIRVWRERKQI